MTREDPQLKIRLPEEMKAHISASAQEKGRSLNAEILARLKYTIQLDEANPRGHGGVPLNVLEQLRPETREAISELVNEALKPVAAKIEAAMKRGK